jgi:REP element-mobilizing transposase RayT
MSQTYTNLNYHLIFGTKDRRPSVLPEFREAFVATLAASSRTAMVIH